MVSGFLFLTGLIIVLAIVSILIFDNITRIARTHSNISQLEIYTLSLIKADNDFFDLETINEFYFKNHQSDYLKRRDSLNVLISQEIQALVKDKEAKKNGIGSSLIRIDTTLGDYNKKFRKLEELVFKKGFKDYGIEGTMRLHAHGLEQIINPDQMLDLLFLRRHEKDFMLRSDSSYVTSFKERSEQFHNKLISDPVRNKPAIDLLTNYERSFLELVGIQFELGLTSKQGLRSELNDLTYSLTNQYYSLSEYSYTYSETTYYRVRIFYITLVIGAIFFSLFSGYWISKRLSEPIANLSKIIQQAILTKQEIRTDLRIKKAAIEITTLAQSYNLLIDQVKIQMEEVEKNSIIISASNQELEKINHELDNFLYSTAHDLRSPLSSLLGLLNLIKLENKQGDLIPYYSLMEKSVQRSEHFISQIVNFSKNKRLNVVAEPLKLYHLISDILESHQFVEGSSEIEKIIDIHGEETFYSDRNRITMIFTNLISNAIKYADFEKPKPFIHITITVKREEAAIEFADNGIGIEEEHIGSIFNMFYRANTRSEGSGLGLFIFKETVSRLSGKVSVTSTPGKGTTFYISLPNLISTLN